MLYLIGLGLNLDGISAYGLETARRCKKIYLENYTVDFPYSFQELEDFIGKKITALSRERVEDLSLIDEAEKMDVALLIYGSPLTATTHITLIQEAKASGIKCKVIYSASILDAVAETGLQLYKFGKITSIPKHEAESFIETVKENEKIGAHSLILVDIGMDFQDALASLEKAAANHKVKLEKLVICQSLGTKNSKIFYKSLDELSNLTGVRKPYCIIIPGKLHFVESEFLESL